MTKKEKATLVFDKLKEMHPNAYCELEHSNPLELLIATILSAQCTDKRVNLVTKVLFKKYRNVKEFAAANFDELSAVVNSTGFFRQKAKNIIATAKKILEEDNGVVPKEIEKLVKLPGVGRKTANVVLGNAFNLPGLPVDTHVKRVTNRIGITKKSDPVEIEYELHTLYKPEDWCLLSHTLIFHGRRICEARKPKCGECLIRQWCESSEV